MDHLDSDNSCRARPHNHNPDPDPDVERVHLPRTIDVYARWTGYDGGEPTSPTDVVQKTHIYSVTIPPSAPLAVGKRVRVLGTTPATWCSPDADPNLHGTHDVHIVGRIRKVIGWKGVLVALAIENECRANLVRQARLEIPYVPNVTLLPLEGLRDGRGPREARIDELDMSATVQPPQPEWGCNASQCKLRLPMPMTARPGVFAVFVFSGGDASQRKKVEKRRAKVHEEPSASRKRLRGNSETIEKAEDNKG